MEVKDDIEEFLEEEGETVALVGAAVATAAGLAASAAARRKAREHDTLTKLGPMGRGATVCPHCHGEHEGFCRAGRRKLVIAIACPVCLRAAGVSPRANLYTVRRVICSVCGGTGFVPV